MFTVMTRHYRLWQASVILILIPILAIIAIVAVFFVNLWDMLKETYEEISELYLEAYTVRKLLSKEHYEQVKKDIDEEWEED